MAKDVDERYTVRMIMHVRLSRGGYMYGYDVLYEDKIIGYHSVVKDKRDVASRVAYLLGETEFTTAEEFKAAHQRSLTT